MTSLSSHCDQLFRSLTLAEQCGPEDFYRADTHLAFNLTPSRGALVDITDPSGHCVSRALHSCTSTGNEYQNINEQHIVIVLWCIVFNAVSIHLRSIRLLSYWSNHLPIPMSICTPYGLPVNPYQDGTGGCGWASEGHAGPHPVGVPVGLWMGFIRVEVGPGRVPAETPDSDVSCAIFGSIVFVGERLIYPVLFFWGERGGEHEWNWSIPPVNLWWEMMGTRPKKRKGPAAEKARHGFLGVRLGDRGRMYRCATGEAYKLLCSRGLRNIVKTWWSE